MFYAVMVKNASGLDVAMSTPIMADSPEDAAEKYLDWYPARAPERPRRLGDGRVQLADHERIVEWCRGKVGTFREVFP